MSAERMVPNTKKAPIAILRLLFIIMKLLFIMFLVLGIMQMYLFSIETGYLFIRLTFYEKQN